MNYFGVDAVNHFPDLPELKTIGDEYQLPALVNSPLKDAGRAKGRTRRRRLDGKICHRVYLHLGDLCSCFVLFKIILCIGKITKVNGTTSLGCRLW